MCLTDSFRSLLSTSSGPVAFPIFRHLIASSTSEVEIVIDSND
jgi:hypothetical protein